MATSAARTSTAADPRVVGAVGAGIVEVGGDASPGVRRSTMHDFWIHLLSVFMGFFAIMNPIANTPVFLGLTASDSPAVRHKVALNAILLTFFIVLFFSVFGNRIFHMFGITLPAFRLTGGAWSR